MHQICAVSLLLSVGILTGCSRGESPPPPPTAAALKVTDISVGRSLGPDRTIAEPTGSFRPTDTFYVSIKTDGSAPSATLEVRWTYEDGQVVDEGTQTIPASGPAVTEFHVSKPDGWPAGEYKVEVLLNGAAAASKGFNVSS
jgi:hypothetical protein